MIACFLSNISAKYYKNLSMLSRVIAKNVGDAFFETQCMNVDTETRFPTTTIWRWSCHVTEQHVLGACSVRRLIRWVDRVRQTSTTHIATTLTLQPTSVYQPVHVLSVRRRCRPSLCSSFTQWSLSSIRM